MSWWAAAAAVAVAVRAINVAISVVTFVQQATVNETLTTTTRWRTGRYNNNYTRLFGGSPKRNKKTQRELDLNSQELPLRSRLRLRLGLGFNCSWIRFESVISGLWFRHLYVWLRVAAFLCFSCTPCFFSVVLDSCSWIYAKLYRFLWVFIGILNAFPHSQSRLARVHCNDRQGRNY